MAGLGAARALTERGVQVTVIEARAHVGGRSFTSHMWPDLPVDLGASWIHGVKKNPLTKLAEELGVPVAKTSLDRTAAFDSSGQSVDFEPLAEEAERLMEAARDAVDDFDADMSLKDAVTRAPAWQALPEAKRQLMRLAIHTRVEHEYSGDWARLSAWYFDDGDDFAGADAVIPEGFSRLAEHLAEGLDIRLNTPVLRIEPQGTGVAVVSASERFTADKVIVTVPLGVLKAGDIAFGAPLKKKRQRAIDGLEMGLLNKCWLRFERVFWPEDMDWIEHLGGWGENEPILWPEFTSFARAAGLPLLVGFNAASAAEAMEAQDDAATVASAMAALRAMFGESVPEPVAAQVTRWKRDPFARGAYSFQPVGTKAKTRRQLFGSDWGDRLFFAGEATSHDHPGTAHGALMTGRAVAKMI